jgi:hypothetical protein
LHITKKFWHFFFYLEYAVQAQESELCYNPGKQSKMKDAKPFLVEGKLGEHHNDNWHPNDIQKKNFIINENGAFCDDKKINILKIVFWLFNFIEKQD